ncbi:hypothetical protein [Paraburkholderia aromaticivorans]|uniref:hypothetical protein n=1 Tax=Paraburkholderia aromaticivorans TaxID=2026199 RepID=UPI0038BB0221
MHDLLGKMKKTPQLIAEFRQLFQFLLGQPRIAGAISGAHSPLFLESRTTLEVCHFMT